MALNKWVHTKSMTHFAQILRRLLEEAPTKTFLRPTNQRSTDQGISIYKPHGQANEKLIKSSSFFCAQVKSNHHRVGTINPALHSKMEIFTEQEEATREQEKNARVTTIFQMVQDSISASQSGQGNKLGRKRKLSTDLVLVPAWREATVRFAENIRMELLIQEFDRCYPNFQFNKRIRVGESGQNSMAVTVPKEKEKNGEVIYLPADILQNIVLRLRPADLVTSRSISRDWATVHNSKYFQGMHDLIEHCIVVNNHNLDMWAFSVISKRWFLMKVPCDWDTFGLKTLGVRASCGGLFLVARSDLTLFVVNPLTSQCKSLPRIFPHTRKRIQFLKSLIVYGTAEMIVDEEATGSYKVFLFGICEDNGNGFVHLARYDSTIKKWRVEKIWFMGNRYRGPLSSALFPGPLRSYRRVDNVIVCFSATTDFFYYSEVDIVNIRLGYAIVRPGRRYTRLPMGIEIQSFYREGHINVTFPTMVPCNPGERALIGRLNGKNSVGGVYGRLPVVPHSDLGIWKFDDLTRQWNLVKVITLEFMQTMIESSQGTDFLAVGDGSDNIWLMLRGSKYMLQYTMSTGILQLQPGCPGGRYMDANINWRAVFEHLGFYAAV